MTTPTLVSLAGCIQIRWQRCTPAYNKIDQPVRHWFITLSGLRFHIGCDLRSFAHVCQRGVFLISIKSCGARRRRTSQSLNAARSLPVATPTAKQAEAGESRAE